MSYVAPCRHTQIKLSLPPAHSRADSRQAAAGQNARSIPPQQAALHAGIAITSAGAFRISDQVRPDTPERFGGCVGHLDAEFTGIGGLAIAGLDGRRIG